MKKAGKIISIAIAAVMMTAAAVNAMTINEPMSYEFPLASYANGGNAYSGDGWSYYPGINTFKGSTYYDNGYTTPSEEEGGEDVKTIDSFDGSTKYLHLESNSANNGFNIFNVMRDYNDNAKSTRFVGSFGKTRLEAALRFDNYIGNPSTADQDSDRMVLLQTAVDKNGNEVNIGIKGYYPIWNEDKSEVKGYMLQALGVIGTEPNYITNMYFGKWYRLRVDIDAQNSTAEYTIEQYRDDKSGEFDDSKKVVRKYEISPIQCTAYSWLRWQAQYVTLDIAQLKTTRDAVDLKELTVDDTAADTVTASVQAASNAPANDFTAKVYDEVDNAWIDVTGTKWAYDNVKGSGKYISKTASPMLILAQYDQNDTLLKVESKSVDIGTLSWGRTATQNTRQPANTAGFNYVPISVSFNKESGYSYAKAYVWNNMSEAVPFADSVSTKTEEVPAE